MDLGRVDVDRMEEHLIGCGSCSAESARAAAIIEGLRSFVPAFVTRAALAKVAGRGLRIKENTFAPGERKSVIYPHETDLLIHRLAGLELSNAKRVEVTVRVESTGDVLLREPNAPFDVQEGVLVACRRHFAALPPDTVFEVRVLDASGAERTAVYTIPHLFPD
jgi:hypothetical protein